MQSQGAPRPRPCKGAGPETGRRACSRVRASAGWLRAVGRTLGRLRRRTPPHRAGSALVPSAAGAWGQRAPFLPQRPGGPPCAGSFVQPSAQSGPRFTPRAPGKLATRSAAEVHLRAGKHGAQRTAGQKAGATPGAATRPGRGARPSLPLLPADHELGPGRHSRPQGADRFTRLTQGAPLAAAPSAAPEAGCPRRTPANFPSPRLSS